MSTKTKKAATEQVANTLAVKFIKNAIALNLCYLPNDIAELETKQAELAIELGFAVLVEASKSENTAAQIADDEQPESAE